MRGEFAHGRVGVHDPRQNVAPRGIGERPEQLVQNVRRWLSTYNHLVVYTSMPSVQGNHAKAPALSRWYA